MKSTSTSRILAWAWFFGAIGNMIFSIYHKELSAFLGWFSTILALIIILGWEYNDYYAIKETKLKGEDNE
ncbi:hypothetical protein LCGC14_1532780 [marine sediment metagenome]|uniref:Uncharacterized protein n=1 Tax=marine sediment metagenome TaxID=412755 RepID=A0A0F9IVJ1_9ZZZZ